MRDWLAARECDPAARIGVGIVVCMIVVARKCRDFRSGVTAELNETDEPYDSLTVAFCFLSVFLMI